MSSGGLPNQDAAYRLAVLALQEGVPRRYDTDREFREAVDATLDAYKPHWTELQAASEREAFEYAGSASVVGTKASEIIGGLLDTIADLRQAASRGDAIRR